MAEISVVLVEPKHECNVGFVARAMKNFGYNKLHIISEEFQLEEKALECAAHGKDILKGFRQISMAEVNSVFDVVIGTTAKTHEKIGAPRSATDPGELSKILNDTDGMAGILFGREDCGLTNEELQRCDMVVSIPGNPEYQTLNISHAAAILFYEMFKSTDSRPTSYQKTSSGLEKEALYTRLSGLLDSLGYPKYKKRVVERIFRRVIGRAGISGREAHTIAGIFKKAHDELNRRERF